MTNQSDGADSAPDDETRRRNFETARAATVFAIRRYREATARSEAAEGPRVDRGDPTGKWGCLAQNHQIDVEETLIVAILAWEEGFTEFDVYSAIKEYREPRGVTHDGMHYLAVPDPTRGRGEEAHGADGADVMNLVVLPTASVVDLDRGAGPHSA
jgi:hypothetical protein